jgi:hypothetical protein
MARKSHKRSASKRSASRAGGRRRKTRRGGYYGATGAIAPGAMEWGRGSEMGEFALSSRGANAIYGSSRKRRHTRRKVRRGGDKYGAVSASYQGTGSRGLIDVVPTTTKYPTAGGPQYGAFNNHGAQPGSGFGSFNSSRAV